MVKEKNRLLQKISDKRVHIKLQSQELKKLELNIGFLTTDLDSCSISRKQLQELVDTLNSDVTLARTQLENKQTEITYWKTSAEERAVAINVNETSIAQWKAHCDTITAEVKVLNDRLTRDISACSVHKELITQYQSERVSFVPSVITIPAATPTSLSVPPPTHCLPPPRVSSR